MKKADALKALVAAAKMMDEAGLRLGETKASAWADAVYLACEGKVSGGALRRAYTRAIKEFEFFPKASKFSAMVLQSDSHGLDGLGEVLILQRSGLWAAGCVHHIGASTIWTTIDRLQDAFLVMGSGELLPRPSAARKPATVYRGPDKVPVSYKPGDVPDR